MKKSNNYIKKVIKVKKKRKKSRKVNDRKNK